MMSNDNDCTEKIFCYIIWLFVAVIAVQILSGFVIYSKIDNWPDRGTFGDMFGSVNTLFSGLAFAGIIYAILLQRKELSLQREELKLTRKELERSAKAQEKLSKLQEDRIELMKKEHEYEIIKYHCCPRTV